ncbi:copper amine oxidase-like protein [Ezakiella coagulans]|uniref:Copper amine oxidase-like protein n=2 Tax=Ezakiella coagulans TaxID=46507 RepID=A0A2U1E3Z0_9FIRM|nr:copper amine oxidase N-terminal domain-containing protein [Ezakiella coagulans]PVY94657.1 copper amine oxidase-like protein [Ezakiella coagulans]
MALIARKRNKQKDLKRAEMLEYLNHLKEIHIRFVAEALGMGVTWDKNTRTVIIEDLLFRVEIPIDTNKIIVNGETYISDVKPEIVDGRTIMPVANIARALGLKDGQDIFWDNATKQVTIIRTISR